MAKILVTGGSGLLGSKFTSAKADDHDIFTTFYTHKIRVERAFQLDITDRESTYKLFKKISPEVVIHTAAMTNVDRCEEVKEAARLVNVEGTENVARASKELDSKMVYVSTDYVFDGGKGMYREDDLPNPVNYYGKTKLRGEEIVKRMHDDYLIVRASVLYGWNPLRSNFATWVIEQLRGENRINIAKDQFNSPTLTDNLAEMIMELVENEARGIFHTAGGERISRLGFARKIANVFNLDEGLITPVTTAELSWVAKRPMDSSLDITKISAIVKPLNIREGLGKMSEQA